METPLERLGKPVAAPAKGGADVTGGSYAYRAAQQHAVNVYHQTGTAEQLPPTPIATETASSESSEGRSNEESNSSTTGSVNLNNDNNSIGSEAQATQEAEAPRQREKRPRIRRIELPVREGADELSDDEGDGEEWGQPPEDAQLPPGYDGPRRLRPEGEKVRPDGKIKPSYYYPTEGSHRGVPVFEPTMEEFKDFNTCVRTRMYQG